LEPISKHTGVHLSKLFIVPGNHDLERSRFDLLPAALNQGVKARAEILPWLADPEKRQRLLDPFHSYSGFLAKRLPHQTAWACSAVFEAGGHRVGIAGLNSAMLCGRLYPDGAVRDYGSLVIGEPQFHEALHQMKNADIRIFVLHHPFEWLAEFDRNDVRRQLLSAAHFVLTGHVHQAEVRAELGTDGDSIALPAGASYDRRNSPDQHYVNSFNFVHLDLDAAIGTAFIEKWSEINTEWTPNHEVFRNGRFQFDLPKDLRKPHTDKPAADVPGIVHALQVRTIQGRTYCLVPAGSFKMGTTPEIAEELSKTTNSRLADETPQHTVWVESFLIGRYPVTNREYKEFVDATGHGVPFRDDALSRHMNWDFDTRRCPLGRDDHPVTLVSWYDAQAYCQWLGGRLPTEAEWEKAARGEDGRQWPWGNTWQSDRCNAGIDGIRDTTPVQQYAERGQSPYGVWDMAGNVWEWTSSHLDPYPYDAGDGREVMSVGGRRAHRGGAWLLPSFAVRCSSRGSADPRDFGFNLGFRVVLPAGK
jgi:formylglycine-generating enzyme required for sulfatase activity